MVGSSAQGIVDVGPGRVRGRMEDGCWVFAGVPYARPPVGPLRWRPPAPPEPWSGVRPALEPGPMAPQRPPVPGLSVPGDPVVQSEDCLSLNVWTPGLDDRRRPVMVWVHGGGFTGGTGASRLYRGDLLAREGDVVVVTLNYRLGALGFLAHPALTVDNGAWGNWGLMDQVAALRWVRDHIGAFGGDPDNVTVFGESAGSMSICALLAMPAARGLFRRAILQSGPPYTHSAGRARSVAAELARELGLPGVDRDQLEAVPAGDLVAAVTRLESRPAGPGELPLALEPAVDGVSLPLEPGQALATGRTADVTLLAGSNRDELTFFVMADPKRAKLGEPDLHQLLARSAPTVPSAEVVTAYRAARTERGEPTSPLQIWIASGSDLVFRWPTLQLSALQGRRGRRTYVYLFTWETPAFGGMLGACHALDIPFVFGSVHDPGVAHFTGGGPEAEALSAHMRAAWVAFARYGDPGRDEATDSWPAWDPVRQATMVLDRRSMVVDAPRSDELAVWQRHLPLGTWRGEPGAPVVDGGATMDGHRPTERPVRQVGPAGPAGLAGPAGT